MILNTNNIIAYIKIILEAVFISLFIYSLTPLNNNYSSVLRICILTILTFSAFIIYGLSFDKGKLKNILNPTLIFFIIFSITQTIKNIYAPQGLPVLGYEIIHYILTIFVLSYNFKERKFLDTGLVLFIVYSFRIFDLHLADNEFVLIHSLTLILALIWLEEAQAKREMFPLPNPIFIPLIILIIVAIFSTANAVCPYKSLAQTAVMINFIFVTFLMAAYLKGIRQINLFIFTLFLIGGALIILAMKEILYQFVTTGSIRWTLSRIWIGRIGSQPPTIHANSIAGYFTVLLCLIISSLSYYKSSIVRRTAYLFIIIALFILELTYSRLGIFSFIFALTILLVFRHKKLINFIRRKPLFLILSAAFIIAIIALSPIKENIISRLRHTHSNNSSLYSCKITLAAIKDNPLFGFGFENYYLLSKYAKQPMVTPIEDAITTTRNLTRSAPHSLYLGIAFGLGTVGLLVFIWLLITFIASCLRLNTYIQDDGYEKSMLQGFFIAFISVIVHGILSMTFHLTVLPAFFWIFIGLVIAIGNIKGYNKKINYELAAWKLKASLIAIILISIGIVINPLLAERYYVLALNNFNSGQLNEAIRKIDRAKRFVPINPKFYELAAEIKIKQGLINEAIEAYKKALYFKQDFAFYHTQLGRLYQQKKMYAFALREFNEAITLDKYGAYFEEHYSDLGFLYEVMGRREEAISQFKKAILINPEVIKNSAWQGLKYLDELLDQMYQDYKIEKDKNPLMAKQILFSLRQVYEYRGEFDKVRDLNLTLF